MIIFSVIDSTQWWLGTRQQLDKVRVQTLALSNATVHFAAVVSDLDVLLDSQLTMSDHAASVSRSCFFYMWQLRLIKQSLTPEATKTLVHAVVNSRLDYCNSLVSVVICYGSCRWFRTLPLVLLPEPEDLSIWRQSCAISTGYRFDSGSHSRRPFWCSSASTTWLHNTYRPTVSRCQLASIVVICNLSNLIFWLFRPLRQTTMIAVLPSIDLVHGTVFLQYCIHWTCLTRYDMNWRLSCSLRNCRLSAFVALCNLVLYNIL